MNALWYARRLRQMSAAEVLGRVRTAGQQAVWAFPCFRPNPMATLLPSPRVPAMLFPPPLLQRGLACDAVSSAADRLLGGQWTVFGQPVQMTDDPNWFHDVLTGRTAPRSGYCFAVPYRDEAKSGNIKSVWELSRFQATMLLASAWWLTRRDSYAERAAGHLRSWWRANPFLEGVHWVSGIELGLRLVAWSWIRALLAEWDGSPALFERNDVFVSQLYQHSRWLRAFRSHGSSANNHVIAELAGLAAASVAFPWFRESGCWADEAFAALLHQAEQQVHADGFNREQASGYHCFVMELLIAAIVPALLASRDVAAPLTDVLSRMADALAASLDATGNPPRFGDSDEGRGVLVDAPERGIVPGLLDAARALGGAAPWWPASSGSVLGQLAGAVSGKAVVRPVPRAAMFPGCGMAILRSGEGAREVWVRCDAGPHGYLSIAAHGHADALSVEARCGGVEVLADPGTYCYHGEPAWRSLFRGTAGHNTLTVAGADQAVPGGPFMWRTAPRSMLHAFDGQSWEASHDGYCRLRPPVKHYRHVSLQGALLVISDWIAAAVATPVLLAFHLGPAIAVSLDAGHAQLSWSAGCAVATLPALQWTMHRGETEPPFGWYSPGFAQRMPATVLAGRGMLRPGAVLESRFSFMPA